MRQVSYQSAVELTVLVLGSASKGVDGWGFVHHDEGPERVIASANWYQTNRRMLRL